MTFKPLNSYKSSSLAPLCVIILIFGSLFAFTGCRIFGSYGDGPSAAPVGPSGKTKTPTLEEERPVVNAKINALSQALKAKDVESAILFFTRKDEYRKLFEDNKDKLPQIGEALKAATLEKVGYYNQYGIRIGGVSVSNSSFTFHINMVKIKGEWFFQDF